MTRLALLQRQIRHRYQVLGTKTADLTSDQAQVRLHESGPTIAWLLHHLTHAAATTGEAVCGLPLPELPPLLSPPDLERLRRNWRNIADATLAGLDTLSQSDLELPLRVPVHPAFEDKLRTRGDWLEGHVYHLSWHLGQVGSLRSRLDI